MELDAAASALAGVLGGAAMTIMRVLMRLAHIELRLNILLLWGTMLGVHGLGGVLIGLAIHLAGSAAIAYLYAWAFVVIYSGDMLWRWGLLGGFMHWIVAGLFMAMVPALHSELPEQSPAPGAFVLNLGAPDTVVFFIGHLLYGVLVAILYALFHVNGGRDLVC